MTVWFDNDYIYMSNTTGKILKQSLLWYNNLLLATEEQRNNYTIGFDGLHWRELNEDISFESFEYADAEPTQLQRFFLTHKNFNLAEFAKTIGVNISILRRYINGFSTPPKDLEEKIVALATQFDQKKQLNPNRSSRPKIDK